MATVDSANKQHSWHNRRRPFTQWVKRLTNLKSSSSDSPSSSSKKGHTFSPSKSKKASPDKHNPYPESGVPYNRIGAINGHQSISSAARQSTGSITSLEDGGTGPRRAPTISNKSAAPTVATNPETVHSETGQSKSGTGRSGGGGANSTFSSPNHSERSLSTTLTTIQSTAPSALLNTTNGANLPSNTQATQPSVQFSHQYPVSPASAIPAHLAPQNLPHTYQAATANGLSSDNASILTLASSSKRRRRNSLDTNASVRALAPSSVFGGSRESLPLSVLSDRVDGQTQTSQGGRSNPNMTGFASAERASVYSSSGVAAPALSSERNSYYASKQIDGASIRSGKLGHGRSESITGSIGGVQPSSPLAGPRDPFSMRASRRSSDWKRADSDTEDEDEAAIEKEENKIAGISPNQTNRDR